MSYHNLVTQLLDIESVKFGNFILKNGRNTSVYIELDPVISFPHILKTLAESIWELMQDIPADRICGVPYTAVLVASSISQTHNIPMLVHRKSSHTIAGSYNPGQTCLVIEDIITTGNTAIETITDLQQAGLMVKDIVTFLDREQGGKELLAEHGYQLHSLFTLSQFTAILEDMGNFEQQKQLHHMA